MKAGYAGILVATLLFSAGVARAQSRTGFAIDRFEPAERGSKFFVGDTLDLRSPRIPPTVGATFDYAYKPLVVRNLDGSERGALVRHQLFAHLGISHAFGERIRFGANVPVALYQDGEDSIVNGEALKAPGKTALGDVRLAVDLRVAGTTTDPFTFALGVRAWLPTGVRSQFTGDGSARIAPQALVAGDVGFFTYAARLALVYRARDDVYAGSALGSEITGAAAAGWKTRNGRLVVGPEIFASAVVTGTERSSPAEALLGVHYDVAGEVRIGAGIGTGITRGYGTPQPRALFSFEWIPRIAVVIPDDEPVLPPDDTPPEVTPPVVVTEAEIKIAEQVAFEFDSADIAPASDAILAQVKKALDAHPEIRRVRVEGHTDDVGVPEYNQALSEKRAASVVKWLIDHGVDPARLESAGFGSTRPIDAGTDDQARARNRRVVFTILLRDAPRK
jgi:outer membrane protein OmpA-like peptidoglycan-associated protein